MMAPDEDDMPGQGAEVETDSGGGDMNMTDAGAGDVGVGQAVAPVPQAGDVSGMLNADSAINDVDLEAYAILGTAAMPVSQLLRMGRGAVVELETGVGDQIDITVNGTLIARGDVVVVEDRVAVKISELVGRDRASEKKG